MLPRTARQALASSLLAPYAVPVGGRLGRIHPEPEDDTRFPFQRDRDRIIHTQAFRRLQGKTQVFVAGEGDHYRTRLTHTMEVTQIARDMARTLGLNEDLAECIALAHDLGHPPFGHAGEAMLDAWLRKHRRSFEHNRQSLRIVTILERHTAAYPGLNLQREVLGGILKHGERVPGMRFPTGFRSSIEAQVVDIADEIAYTAHDTEDGRKAGLFAVADMERLPIVRSAFAHARHRGTSLRGALIHLLVHDVYDHATRRLAKQIHASGDVTRLNRPVIRFSAEMRAMLSPLRRFLHQRLYFHPRVRAATTQGQAILRALCDEEYRAPSEKVLLLRESTGCPLAVAVADYVSGMTDAYAHQHALSRGILPS
ncbi:MAG: dGTPase [Candidatus Peregrinibacteria bacterium Gr01-1014_25]|nr:MAG: dGTPase [Candidatus Peregrinibacteria bacterium Gr01-1014_25]